MSLGGFDYGANAIVVVILAAATSTAGTERESRLTSGARAWTVSPVSVSSRQRRPPLPPYTALQRDEMRWTRHQARETMGSVTGDSHARRSAFLGRTPPRIDSLFCSATRGPTGASVGLPAPVGLAGSRISGRCADISAHHRHGGSLRCARSAARRPSSTANLGMLDATAVVTARRPGSGRRRTTGSNQVREGEREERSSPGGGTLIRLAVAVAVSVLLVMAALAARQTEGGDAVAREAVPVIGSEASGAPVLARLGLDDTQKERVERLRAEEHPRVEWLRRALAEIEQEIRREELASPFDAERVNGLIGRQAELTAHLRGTESRVVSRIAELLSSEQRRRLAELRVEGAPRAEAPSTSNSHAPPFAPRVGTARRGSRSPRGLGEPARGFLRPAQSPPSDLHARAASSRSSRTGSSLRLRPRAYGFGI